mgnify:FL=1
MDSFLTEMILEIIILLLGIPVGYLIALMARDELKAGRKWFGVLVIASILGAVWFYLIGESVIVWSFGFVGVISAVGLGMERNKSKKL